MNDTVLLVVNGWAGRSVVLDGVMIFCAVYLIYILFAVGAACVGYYIYRREWSPVAYFCAALAVSFILVQVAPLLVDDQRPFVYHELAQLVAHEPGRSFPSNHTASAAAVALGVLAFTRFKLIGAVLFVAACVIGLSRVFVGVHYPGDIIGGVAMAAAGVCLVLAGRKVMEGKSFPPASQDKDE